jgi:hypothetical protein
MSVSLTGNDTLIIDTRIMKDLANGDTCVLDFPNNLMEAKVGKNGNAIFAFNSTGQTVNNKLRVIRGSADDKYLNSRLNEYLNDPPGFVLMKGEFIKRVGDGAGNITNEIYKVNGGIPQKFPSAKENVEGDIEQAVAEWNIVFVNADRILS